MPVVSAKYSEADYLASRYDLQAKQSKEKKQAENKQAVQDYLNSKQDSISPGQPVYLEITNQGVQNKVLTAPNKNATTTLRINSKEYFSKANDRSQVQEQPSQPIQQPQTFKDKVVNAYTSTVGSVDRFYQEKVLSPLISLSYNPKSPFYKSEEAKGKVLVDKSLGGVGQFIKGVREETIYQPTNTIVTYGLFKGGGKLLSSSPKINSAIQSTKGKVVGGILLGSYGVGVTKEVLSSNNKGFTLGQESTKLIAATSGFKSGFKFNPKSILINTKPIEKVEGFKVITKSKDLGGNVIDYYRGKPTSFSGGQQSEGAGLYKVGEKNYRVLFKEKGLSKTVGDNKFTRSTAVLNVQPYKEGLNNLKVPSGKVSKVYMKSEQVTFPSSDNQFRIKGLAQIRAKGSPQVTRLVSAKATIGEQSTKVEGFNVDTFRGKVIPNSQRQIKGFSTNVLSAQKGEATYSVDKSSLFGRNIPKTSKVFKQDMLSNAKSFNRKEFVTGSNSLVQSTKVIPSQSTLTTSTIKDLVGQRYSLDVAKTKFNVVKNVPKPVLVSKTTTKTLPSNSIKSAQITKNRYDLTQRVQPKTSNILGTTTKSFSDIRTKQNNISKVSNQPMSRVDTQVKNSQMMKQSQSLKTSQILKTSSLSRPRTTSTFTSPTLPLPVISARGFKFNSFKSNPKLFKSLSKRGSIAPKYSYVPSLQARIFNIKGKITSKEAKSGLIIRPIVARVK